MQQTVPANSSPLEPLIPLAVVHATYGMGRPRGSFRKFLVAEVKAGRLEPGVLLGNKLGWTRAQIAAWIANAPRGGRKPVDGMAPAREKLARLKVKALRTKKTRGR